MDLPGGDSRMPWGLRQLGCASQNSSKSNTKPCAPPANCLLGSLTVKPHAGLCFSSLSFLMGGTPCTRTSWVRTAPCLASRGARPPGPFFFPFGLSLCHLSSCLLLPTARASWGQGQVWVQALLPQGVFSAQGRGRLQSLLPRGVQG